MEDSETPPATKQRTTRTSRNSRNPLACRVCWRVFARNEHLTRHLRIHTKEKPFMCGVCGKGFSRMDILNRHTVIHSQKRREYTADYKVKRACVPCASSRVRCSREEPCARCDAKGLSCEYRGSPRKRPAIDSDSDSESGREGETDPEPDASPRPDIPDGNPVIATPVLPAVELGDHQIQQLPGLTTPTNHEDQDALHIPSLLTYETDSRHEFMAQPMSGINWLSPGQTILQEWGTLLDGIPDVGVFPAMLSMLDFPEMPQVAWDPSSQQLSPGRQSPGPQSPCLARTDPLARRPAYSEAESPATFVDRQSTGTSGSTESRYYVHGTAWRAPFRRRLRHSRSISGNGPVDGPGLTSDPSPGTTTNDLASGVGNWLTEDMYARLILDIQEETQTRSLLPSLPALRLCVHLYFERLHPNFPFIHKASFLAGAPHWVLLLAIAGVGAAYLRSSQGLQWRDSLMQVLEKIVSNRLHRFHSLPEADNMQPADVVNELLPLIQAKTLHLLCMLHSNTAYTMRAAVFERAELVQWCSYLNLVSAAAPSITSEANVQLWINRQSQLRTGMMIWLLDSMVSYELGCKHLMKLGDIGEYLPSHDIAWNQPSLANIDFAQSFSMSLLDALDMIYIEKRLPPQLSQFSHILLIHAIYRRTSEVMDQSRMRLSSWSPTANVQTVFTESPLDHHHHHHQQQQTWPPSNSLVSNWRNAACDSLDVLHWAANSVAAESCWEEPTILYLHLARLILLAPVAHFQTLAKYPVLQAQNRGSARTTTTDNVQEYENARSQVLQWAIRDQFKARLAVVHAGALLWHVRRFSTDNVIEPFSIYVATLLLWAYSVSTDAVRGQTSTSYVGERRTQGVSPGIPETRGEYHEVSNDSDGEPRWIYLDRPLDDELVQMYIRVGDRISAQLKGVGDISKREAPFRILKQGLYLLTGERYVRGGRNSDEAPGEAKFYTWEIQRAYAATIQSLIGAIDK